MGEKFSIGDKVRLKSNGPLLTVYKVNDDAGTIGVVWFDKAGELRMGTSPSACFEKEK